MFSFGCHSESQFLAMPRAENRSVCATRCSRSSAKPPPFASNCQTRFASGATDKMLQECQRAMEFWVYE
jgi:hypothetical protein